MNKQCKCGHEMRLALRTVIHDRTIHIHHVPVLTCPRCERSELYPAIKQEITDMIRCRKAGQSKELHGGEQEGDFVPRHYFFEEINEAASVLAECADAIGPGDLLPYAEEVMNDRINKLLDMYLLAKTLEDEEWMSELQERLKQISGFSFYPDRVKIS
ncbi:hypothetical protein [Paenibacillus dendritiformis]|uniref:hypothetical protein n=1 Tax=Paenibacillus dendritiformis TaxID=130049 RepID=UPI001FF0A659|nr:hypothetical protein [Paenibacillus dendritiformis]